MSRPLLVRGIRQLLTLRGSPPPRRGRDMNELGIVPDAAMLIQDGRLLQVGPAARVENLAAARTAEVLDSPGHVVIPGLIDAHTHLVHGPPRLDEYEARLQGAPADSGLAASVRALRSATASRLRFHAAALLRHSASLGVTTLEARTGYGLDESAELKVLRLLRNLDGEPLGLCPTYLGPLALPPEFAGRPDAFVDFLIQGPLPRVSQRRLAAAAAATLAHPGFAPALVRRYLEAAHRHGLPLRVAACPELLPEAASLAASLPLRSIDQSGPAPAPLAGALARSSAISTLLPGPAFHLGHGRFPSARLLIDAGAPVALASGFNPASSPSLSMPLMLSLACSHLRMTPAEALTAATLNAASVLGLSHETGSLETGKWADFTVLEASDYRELPYHFGMNLVALTVRRGRVIHRKES